MENSAKKLIKHYYINRTTINVCLTFNLIIIVALKGPYFPLSQQLDGFFKQVPSGMKITRETVQAY